MITLEHDKLVVRCPEVHEDAVCRIDLQRTLRIPDDAQHYPLPPGLGSLPLRHIEDYHDVLPKDLLSRGGCVMPMHQAEAMWVNFGRRRSINHEYPFAVKVAAGKINAVTGEAWTNHLNADPQDYLVIPKQPWIDGYCVDTGVVRQFVAMPLGVGYSVEEQLTEAAEHGGIQFVFYPMKRERFEQLRLSEQSGPRAMLSPASDTFHADSELCSMGLGAGGTMRQEIYNDLYGLDAWDQRHPSRCFVTILNSLQWEQVTGERPPTTPPTAEDYEKAGLPWFEYYGGDERALKGSETLRGIRTVTQLGAVETRIDKPLVPGHTIGLGGLGARPTPKANTTSNNSTVSEKPEYPSPLFPEDYKRKHHDDALEALLQLGGTAHRTDVIRTARKIRQLRGDFVVETYEATLQHAFERCCRDSDVYRSDPRPNLAIFTWPNGKGEGTWGVDHKAASAYLDEIRKRNPTIDDLIDKLPL